MAEIQVYKTVVVQAKIDFNEVELRALDALVGYGIEPFLGVFYEKLGRHYLKPFEAGMRSLFATIKADVNPALRQVTLARAMVQKQEQAYVLEQKRKELEALEQKQLVGEDAGLASVFEP